MSKRSIITAGLLAATAVGAGVAQAAPTVTSVEANRTGRGRLEIVVQAARGTATTPPVITATINGRTRTAHPLGWASATQPTDTVTYSAKFQRGRLSIGPSVNVTITACDAPGVGCTATPYTLTVGKATPAASRPASEGTKAGKGGKEGGGDHAPATPPAGSITSDQAIAIALAKAGDGATLRQFEFSNEHGGQFEVKVAKADGTQVEVKIALDGTVLKIEIDH